MAPGLRGLAAADNRPQTSMTGLALGVGMAVGLGLAVVLFLLAFLFLKVAFRKKYPVHKSGAVVLTGASTGIGHHAAQHLAKRGFVVYATVRKQKDVDALNKLEIPTLVPVIMDVAQPGSVEAGVQRIRKELETSKTPLVGLVNNAGVAQTFPVEFHKLTDVRSMYDVHVFGPLDLTQRLLPELRKNQGRIVNISSITSTVIIPTGSVYGSSKLALEAISVGLRRELELFGCSVSIVQPAYVNTAIFDKIVESVEADVEPSEVIMGTYGHFFRPEKQQKDLQSVARASPPDVTTKAITHALTSAYPQTRYMVANVDGVPAWVLGWLVHVCPDRFADFIMKQFS